MPRSKLLITMLVTVLGLSTIANPLFGADNIEVLHSFGKPPDGGDPVANLIFDNAGNLYGTTYSGGTYDCGYNFGCGTVFRLTPERNGQWNETVLHYFTGGGDGCSPSGNLLFDTAGNLYGTASGNGDVDGPCNDGTVFEISPGANGSWTFKVLYTFKGGSDGEGPVSLVFDGAGNLYGNTTYGGGTNAGTVFELSPGANGSWTEKVLYSFTYAGDDGFYPAGGLALDNAGNLYGITCCGGGTSSACPYNFGCGVIFELTPSAGTWTQTVIHKFSNTDGSNAGAGLISDAAGNLYGTTEAGGASGIGLVFELSLTGDGSWTEKVLHNFNNADIEGNNPAGTLIFDSAGNLYGTTLFGGDPICHPYGCGSVFEVSPQLDGNWIEKTLVILNGGNGEFPQAGLIFGSDGNLYGDASGGNANGTVFEVTQ